MTDKERMLKGKAEAIDFLIASLTRIYTGGPFGYLEKDQTRGDIENSYKLLENKVQNNDISNFFYNAEAPVCFTANELLIYYKFNDKFESIINSGYTDDKKLVDLVLTIFKERMGENRLTDSGRERAKKMCAKGMSFSEAKRKINGEEFNKRYGRENISGKIKNAKEKDDHFEFYIYKIQKSSEKIFEEGTKKVTSKGKKTSRMLPSIKDDEGR